MAGLPSNVTHAVSIAGLWVSLLSTPAAQAFVCAPTAHDCTIQLSWAHPTIPVWVNHAALPEKPAQTLIAAARAAEGRWSAVACSPLQLVDGAPGAAARVTPILSGWGDRGGSLHTAALTVITYEAYTGRITAADIEVNYNGHPFEDADLPGCADAIDLQAVLTHELGHLVGLAHPCAPPGAVEPCPTPRCTTPGPRPPTMWPLVGKCDPGPRSLEPDDIAGLCALYPDPGSPHRCGGLPDQGGGYLQSQAPGCRCATAQTPTPWPALWLLGLLALARRRDPSPPPKRD